MFFREALRKLDPDQADALIEDTCELIETRKIIDVDGLEEYALVNRHKLQNLFYKMCDYQLLTGAFEDDRTRLGEEQ